MPSAVPIIRLAAYFGPPGGGPPDYDDPPSSEWKVTRIDESDPRHPKAYLTRALTTFAVDRTSVFQTREVQIWACDVNEATDDPDYRVTPLFWGEVNSNSISIREGETETAVAQVHRYHYGEPLSGETVYDPDNEATTVVHRDARFNPTIDSKVTPNMAERVDQDGYPETHNLWIDPESTRTEEALAVHLQTDAKRWSLGLAVETLQRVLNSAESFLTNIEIFADPETPEAPFDNAQDPENVTLKRGMFLDQCLEQILPQYGCGFYVHPAVVDDDPDHAARYIAPEIRYYQRGVGTEKELKLQAPLSAFDSDDTNLLQADIEFNVAGIVNQIIAQGHPQEREVTIELVRAWPEDDDSKSAEQLTRGVSGSEFEDYPAVWRKWVFNEAGDYDGLRPETTPEDPETTTRPDLSEVFDGYVPKRRRIYPPLTYRALADTETVGLRGPVKVEFTTEEDPDPEDWLDVTGEEAKARFIVLENEIGIYFNGTKPPEALIDGGDDTKVRVTGTLVGDQCLVGQADVPVWSPNANPVTLLIDVGDRYFDRQRQTTGDYASVLTGDHDEKDDQTAIDNFATSLRDQEAAASVAARITISGITTDYGISDLLTGISGRNISFNRSTDTEEPLYVQIVGRVFDGDAQTTTLIVAPYDRPQSNYGGSRSYA